LAPLTSRFIIDYKQKDRDYYYCEGRLGGCVWHRRCTAYMTPQGRRNYGALKEMFYAVCY